VTAAIRITRKAFRFSDVHLARLSEILSDTPRAGRFITSARQIIDKSLESQSNGGSIPTVEKLRANAKELQKATRTVSAKIGALTVGEKELLGQLMWVIDNKSYYPAAFTVDHVLETVRALGTAASKLVDSGKGGRTRLRLDGFIRDIHSAYITSLNRRPETTKTKSNNFMSVLKVCLEASGEAIPRALLQLTREALNP
jgi:hypothetical protein